MPSIDVGLNITAINNATGAIRGVGRDVRSLGENAQATANRLKAIQVVIAGILIEKTIEFGRKAIEAAAATQNLDLRMAGFAGSAEKAHKVWDNLASTLGATPFKMDTIANGWIKLRSAVASNDQASTIIKAIVNDVTALGGKDENVTNLAEALQRMMATGIATSREYKSILQQTGLTMGDLAEAAHKTATAITYNLQHGFTSAQQFMDMFVAASNQRFGFVAQNMRASIGGAFTLVSNTISKGITEIGAKTDVNARVTIVFQRIAAAIDSVMGSIKQPQITAFFKWLADVWPLAVSVAKAIVAISQAVLTVASAAFRLLGTMTPEMAEFGLIGYFIFGKKGFFVLSLLPRVASELNTTSANVAKSFDNIGVAAKKAGTNTYQAFLDFENKAHPGEYLSNMTRAISDYAGGEFFSGIHKGVEAAKPEVSGFVAWIQKEMASLQGGKNKNNPFIASPEEIAKVQARLDALMKSFKSGVQTNASSASLVDAMKAADNLTQQLNDTLQTTRDRIDEINAKTGGDQLGAALMQAKIAGDGILKSIDGAVKAENALKVHTKENLDIVAKLLAARGAVVDAIDREADKIRLVNTLMVEQFRIQQAGEQLQNRFAAVMMDINSNTTPMANIFQGLSGGQAAMQTLQQQATLLQQINQLDSQRQGLEIQLQEVLKSGGSVDAIKASMAAIDDLKTHTQTALDALTIEGQMTKELWKDLASTMENDIGNGLSGLIQGTMTLGDVMRQVFSDMISLGIKFLLKLIEIQIFGEVAQQASLAAMGPTAIAAQTMWAPAAMAASIATMGGADVTGTLAYQTAMATALVPFAKGGVPGLNDSSILTGPTMFGLAGEAGDEAIMPLTRIGGKLGVKTTGSGNHYEIHVHAIDTQSGLEFIGKHIDHIDGALMMRGRLNIGGGR